MSSSRTVASVASIAFGLSAAVAQPVFESLMVDAKGKTVGRFFVEPGPNNFVVRQINGIWVWLQIADFKSGFTIVEPANGNLGFAYQSADCTGQAYLPVNGPADIGGPTVVTGPVMGVVTAIPPATAPSIYFAGELVQVTLQSFRYVGNPCQRWGDGPNPNYVYVGPAEIVPVSSLGLTLPFSIK
jgi:hypothetical protein